ncbi:serine hydroxymethyltransferase [Sulfolobales archaeon HS-7]|nr:serine hydroxymethyltransferase [Sulfolobales archaeon HS-7]
MSESQTLEEIIKITYSHNKWRRTETLNLIPSENVMSPLAESLYLTDMMSRYAEGKPYKRYYQGTKFVDEIEVLANKLISQVSNAKYSDLKATSGTIANAAVFRTLANCGDKAVIAPVQAGAHVSHTRFGTLGALGIKQIDMSYDQEIYNIDVDNAVKLIEKEAPKFVVLGGSLYLFPHPVKEIAEAAHSVNAQLVYDAAHVYGLITGGVWENPLSQGADVMTASTHKTFPGPQGGVIVSNEEEVFKPISKNVFPWFVSNHHLHRLPATAVTALEMIKFGHEYASQIVKNAKSLAESLVSRGFKVIGEELGYTSSHQVAINVKELGGGAYVAKELEEANIITNKNLLPQDTPDKVENPSGIRLGVQEMTRYGMKEDDMDRIASFMESLLIRKESKDKIKHEVIEFRSQFLEVKYTFNIDLGKYSSFKIPMLI